MASHREGKMGETQTVLGNIVILVEWVAGSCFLDLGRLPLDTSGSFPWLLAGILIRPIYLFLGFGGDSGPTVTLSFFVICAPFH